MKKFKLPMIMVIILTFGITLKSKAQQQSDGLYLTFTDYQNHKLSYGSITKGDKIAIHDFLEGNTITVISNGNKQTFLKKEIFGFRKNNQDYRFQDNKVYQIIDTEGFYLYRHDRLTQQNKGLKPVSTVYFSTKADSGIVMLTEENIDKAFAANHKFRNSVQAEFKNDDALNEYDTVLRKYKIKELYSESAK
ncbi:hypothetical protein ACPPVU_22015 [Mucilaginibacter sp. McL0603]|uniref:hypothetical protein n=1 Tax=Mucilaginibacter sp. McL0603 TaxID=3415670 RepID=UPI003CEC6D9E